MFRTVKHKEIMKKQKDICSENNYYHVYNRGVGKNNIFIDNYDRERFLCSLFVLNNKNSAGNILWQLKRCEKEVSFSEINRFFKENNIKKDPLVYILAYCLKDNHFHLLLKELEEGGVATFMHKLGGGYARYFNERRGRKGVFFEGRYRQKRVSGDDYLCYLLAYINIINPLQEVFLNIKEKGVDDLSKALNIINNYKWSSHKEYITKVKQSLTEKDIFEDVFKENEDYVNFVNDILSYKRDVWQAESVFLE